MPTAQVSERHIATQTRFFGARDGTAAHVIATLCCILGVALAFRVLGIGGRSFWYDEIMSIQRARSDWSSFLKATTDREANMLLYYCILRIWVRLGDGEAFLRGLSVAFSLVTIPVLCRLGAQLFSPRVGLFAALLMSVNTFEIRYAQEARSYSLLVLLVTLSSLYWVKAVDGASGAGWRRYIVVAGASIYAHFFAGLVVVAHGLSLACYTRHPLPWRRLGRMVGVLAVVVLPAAVFVVGRDKGQLAWIEPAPLSAVWALFIRLAGNTGLTASIYGFLCLYALGTAWLPLRSVRSQAPEQRPDRWPLSVVVLWLCTPVVLTWTASLFKPMFVDRYLITGLPALVLLAAVGLSRITSRAGRAVVLTGIAIGSAHSLRAYYHHEMLGSEGEDWRGVTRDVMRNARDGDAIVLYPGWIGKAFPYYQPAARERDRPDILSARAWGRRAAREPSIQRLADRYENLWVIVNPREAHSARYAEEWRQIQRLLGQNYAASETYGYTGLEVVRFSGPLHNGQTETDTAAPDCPRRTNDVRRAPHGTRLTVQPRPLADPPGQLAGVSR